MSKRAHIFFVCSCFVGFAVSFFQLLMGESQTFTAEQALFEFSNNGIEFDVSIWGFFTFAFLLGKVLWIWRLRRI